MTGSGIKASFTQKPELVLELPRGTILEVEVVSEMTGAVRQNGQINEYNGQIELTNGHIN